MTTTDTTVTWHEPVPPARVFRWGFRLTCLTTLFGSLGVRGLLLSRLAHLAQ